MARAGHAPESGLCRLQIQDNRLWAPPAKGAHLGGPKVTYQEREIETIRRLREALAARRDAPRPEWMVQQSNGGQVVQLDEVAELLYEVQS